MGESSACYIGELHSSNTEEVKCIVYSKKGERTKKKSEERYKIFSTMDQLLKHSFWI